MAFLLEILWWLSKEVTEKKEVEWKEEKQENWEGKLCVWDGEAERVRRVHAWEKTGEEASAEIGQEPAGMLDQEEVWVMSCVCIHFYFLKKKK